MDVNLDNVAAELQQVLEKLSQIYPTETKAEQLVVVGKAVNEIDIDRTLSPQVAAALKAGHADDLRELVKHPLIKILLAALAGWQDAV
ncbi:MAG TPA: hypothetical protein V6C88_05460 [Chroococcidiopsis sp.]